MRLPGTKSRSVHSRECDFESIWFTNQNANLHSLQTLLRRSNTEAMAKRLHYFRCFLSALRLP